MVACWLHFSDGSRAHLNLFDPSSYKLMIASLDNRVVSVRKLPSPIMVAESEGWGLLFTAELTICEACQKSKRKSKLAVSAGNVRVKFPSPEHRRAQTEAKLSLTPFQGLLRRNTTIAMQESTTRDISVTSAKSKLQEAMGGAISTIRLINSIKGMTGTRTYTEKAITPASPANILTSSDLPSQPKQEVPLHKQDLVWTYGIFTHVEMCIYLLLGLSCLAIIIFLINCGTQSVRTHGGISSVECRGPDEHIHHWVRLGTVAEQAGAVPIATISNLIQKVPSTVEGKNPATENDPERTATLGRRCSTLPLRTKPVALNLAGPLAKPARNEPLHSPTSKRNQVQFTTFTTLDIKHLAALKKSWLDWTNQGPNQTANQGDPSRMNCTASQSIEHSQPKCPSEIPWPVVKPVVQGK